MRTDVAEAEIRERAEDVLAHDFRYIVVSADSHVGPSMERQLRPYCPRKFLDDFDQRVAVLNAAAQARDPSAGLTGTRRSPASQRNVERANLVRGQWDPAAFISDMDAEGISATVIFHGTSNLQEIPFVSEHLHSTQRPSDTAMYAAGCNIFNRWLADFCSTAPERLFGIAQIPITDVDACVREIKWAAEAGLKGVNLPAPKQAGYAPYVDPQYEPLWSVCEDLSMPLNTHSGPGLGDSWRPPGPWQMAIGLLELPFFSRRGVWQMILSGVFERHPSLKLVLTEQSATWLPELVRDIDDVYVASLGWEIREFLPRRPSEYWNTNCYVAASGMSRQEAGLYPNPWARHLMWGSDYPHFEGTYPYTKLALRFTYAGVPPQETRAMLGETAIELFQLDGERLRAIADRIGPTVGDLSVAPEQSAVPKDYTGFAFRNFGSFG
jgi:predicted TIM-barrel fold metal-dependent hydrolase